MNWWLSRSSGSSPLKYGAAYVCQKIEVYEAAYRARVVKGLARKAAEFGYRLEPAAATGS